MEPSSTGIHWLAQLAFTLVLIGFMAFAVRQVSQGAYTMIGKSSDVINEVSDSDITMFEGLEVRGSDVIGQINKYINSDKSVKVKTNKSVSYYNKILESNDTVIGSASTRTTKETQEISSNYYINKSAKFTGKVLYDVNNAIIGIEFTQK
jgi:hypothetical protein